MEQKNLLKTGKDNNLDPVLLFPANSKTKEVKSYPQDPQKASLLFLRPGYLD